MEINLLKKAKGLTQKFVLWISPSKNETKSFARKVTIFYFVSLTSLCILLLPFLTLPNSYNELGDFLAGVFSPVAFFWLIIGYLMQHNELEINRNSLNQQVNEFKKSVKIAERNFKREVKKHQHDLETTYFKSQPIFEISDREIRVFNENNHIKIYIKCHINKCFNLQVFEEDRSKGAKSALIPIIETGKPYEIEIYVTPKNLADLCKETIHEILEIEKKEPDLIHINAKSYLLTYTDELGIKRRLKLHLGVDIKGENHTITADIENYSRKISVF
ncbi:hypothetical protein N5P32_08435 [Marinomonas pontica]|uniref:hypothetical protein n=1 Tax=Marinomonas pontica TaxID=264739 RepID=UPI0022443689|nr:hypothetical protein [Marinomonas pontica]MCW8355912.1 hypothetical protein [Marinomonas pontica]